MADVEDAVGEPSPAAPVHVSNWPLSGTAGHAHRSFRGNETGTDRHARTPGTPELKRR